MTVTTEWTPEWASVTLSRRKFFILEVEPQIFMALGVQPTVEIKDHRCGYEALLRETYGMFRLFHGSIERNLRLLPSVGGPIESDMTLKKDTDGLDLLMDIAAMRKRLRKLRLAIDSLTYHKPLDVTSEDEQQDEELVQFLEEKKTTEAELKTLMAVSPAISLQKKCAGFFPTLLQSLDVRSSSAFSELQGLGYFPMDQLTFLTLQTFVNGFHIDLRFSESAVGAESIENLALFFKGNLLWSSLGTTTMYLLYKFLRLREERGMTMLRGDDKHDVDDVRPGRTLPINADAELWMANRYEDTFLPVWSSKLSYTECDVVAQSVDGRPRVRKSARSLHKQHPVSLSTFLSETSLSSGGLASTPRSGLAAEPSQSCPPSHSPASLTRLRGAQKSGTSPVNLQSAIKARARSPSFQNAGLMLKNGCFSKLLDANREMQSGRVWTEIKRVWSPPIFPLDNVSTSNATTTPAMMAARHRVVVWHEADLTMIILLRLDETELDSTDTAPTLKARSIERLQDYLESQQRFQTLAQLLLTRYTATFAPPKNIPTLPSLPPFLYINRVNLAFRMQQVPRLLKSKEDDLFPVPGKLLVHYFPASTTALVNDLHAKLHGSLSTGNREICVLTSHAGWVFAKKSETSHRELYVFIDSKVGSSVYDLSDEQLQREEAHLRVAISNVSNEALKNHMLTALNAFKTSTSSILSTGSINTSQKESDKSDAIAVKLRETSVTVQQPRDALFLAIHALLLEAGYKLSKVRGSEFVLPENWDANSASGLFNAEYVHLNDETIKFSLQGLFVGDKFEVYISDDKDHIHSIELSVDKFVVLSESTSPVVAASLLQNLKDLREKFTPFAESIQPALKKKTTAVVSIPMVHPPDRDDREDFGIPSPARIPPVGEGDAFPSSLGGGNPDMLVGPDHPIFGHRGDPSQSPVPGARFDPFGPSIDPLGPSGFHRPPPRGPAPTMPFGGPGPDHLRMPCDHEMDPNFGSSGRGSRGGGGPFGSNHSFF